MKSSLSKLVFALSVCGFVSLAESPEFVDPASLLGPVYELDPQGLFAVAEAEHLAAAKGTAWTVVDEETEGIAAYWSADWKRYTGSGFVLYSGPRRTGPDYLEDEAPYTKQGPKADWLAIKFYVPPSAEGEYEFAFRYAHIKEDGDNDCFAAPVGISREVIKRAGFKAQHQFRSAPNFSQRSNSRFLCRAGINAFYIAGRSIGFGVDRLMVWKVDGGDSVAAKDVETPESNVQATRVQP